jgi:antitoxin (DNA-binding transcriptional repressor) of toxin-antitoxin stability system
MLVAYAFGRRSGGPDPVNRALAERATAHLRAGGARLLVTQHDLARWLDDVPAGVRVEVCEDHLPVSRYVNTGAICSLAARLRPVGPVHVVAHGRHLRRVLATHRALGLPAVPLDGVPGNLDPGSEQWWTRSRPAWWMWQAAAWPKVLLLAGRRERDRRLL